MPPQALQEEFYLGLRQLEGIDFGRIERDYEAHLPDRLATLRERIDQLRSTGFVEVDGSRLRIAPTASPFPTKSSCSSSPDLAVQQRSSRPVIRTGN